MLVCLGRKILMCALLVCTCVYAEEDFYNTTQIQTKDINLYDNVMYLKVRGIYLLRQGEIITIWVPNRIIFPRDGYNAFSDEGRMLLEKISEVTRAYKKNELEIMGVYVRPGRFAHDKHLEKVIVNHQTRMIGDYIWQNKVDVTYMSIGSMRANKNMKLPFWSRRIVASPFTLIKFKVVQ